jgi:hypothetical protein
MLGKALLLACDKSAMEILKPYITWVEAKAEFEDENEALLEVYKKVERAFANRWR